MGKRICRECQQPCRLNTGRNIEREPTDCPYGLQFMGTGRKYLNKCKWVIDRNGVDKIAKS